MASTATIHVDQETAFAPPLFLAFELGVNKWKLGCTTGQPSGPESAKSLPKGPGGDTLGQEPLWLARGGPGGALLRSRPRWVLAPPFFTQP
jgi:hypothetical protein